MTLSQRPTVRLHKTRILDISMWCAGERLGSGRMTGPAVWDMKPCLIIMTGRTWQMHEERSWTTHTYASCHLQHTDHMRVCVCVRCMRCECQCYTWLVWTSRCVAGLGYKYTIKKILIPMNMMRYERSLMLRCQVRSMRITHSDLKGSWHEKSDLPWSFDI